MRFLSVTRSWMVLSMMVLELDLWSEVIRIQRSMSNGMILMRTC